MPEFLPLPLEVHIKVYVEEDGKFFNVRIPNTEMPHGAFLDTEAEACEYARQLLTGEISVYDRTSS